MTSKDTAVTVGGQRFRFVKPTIEAYVEILSHGYDTRFSGVDFKKILQDETEYRKFKILWREFCNGIFEKSFLWRLLWRFGYLPRELRFDSILMAEIGEVIKSFFGWQGAAPSEASAPSGTSSDSKPGNE